VLDINGDHTITADELQTRLQQGDIDDEEYRLLMGLDVHGESPFSISVADFKRGPVLLTVLDAMPENISSAFYRQGGPEITDVVKKVFLEVIGRSHPSPHSASSSSPSSESHSSARTSYTSLLLQTQEKSHHSSSSPLKKRRKKTEEDNPDLTASMAAVSFLSMEERVGKEVNQRDPLEELFGEEEGMMNHKKKKHKEDEIAAKVPLVNLPKNSKILPGIFVEESPTTATTESSPLLSDSSTAPTTKTSLVDTAVSSDAHSVGPEEVRLAGGFGDFLKKAAGGVMAAAGSIAGAVAGAVMGSKKTNTTKANPKSEYGVPSFVDEECVICQYVTELTQRSLYDHLTMGQGEECPHQSDLREINQQVMQMPNGRGIVRIITENTIIAFCDPRNVPEIFYPYCETLWTKLRSIAHSIFFQYGSAAVCLETGMCASLSYVNDKTSVHLPSKSKQYNSGRGKCGMMGGVHEDSKSLTATVLCTAQKMLLS